MMLDIRYLNNDIRYPNNDMQYLKCFSTPWESGIGSAKDIEGIKKAPLVATWMRREKREARNDKRKSNPL